MYPILWCAYEILDVYSTVFDGKHGGVGAFKGLLSGSVLPAKHLGDSRTEIIPFIDADALRTGD